MFYFFVIDRYNSGIIQIYDFTGLCFMFAVDDESLLFNTLPTVRNPVKKDFLS